MIRPLLLLFVAAFPAFLPAQVCDAAAFGPPTADPITITGAWTVGPGCVLDFGDREVVLAGTLDISDATILAGDLHILSTGRILGGGGFLDLRLTGSTQHAGRLLVEGKIKLKDPAHGGTVLCTATGPVEVTGSGQILVDSTSSTGDGGRIEIACASAWLEGAATTLGASGGGQAGGGTVLITAAAGDIHVGKKVDCSGGAFDGGVITLETAVGDIDVSGTLDVQAAADGWGGEIDLWAAGAVSISGSMVADGGGGGGSGYGYGGDGGYVDVSAGGAVSTSGDLLARGGPQAYGGDLRLTGAAGVAVNGGRLLASSSSGDGAGGGIEIDGADGPVSITGVVEAKASASSGDGGDIIVAGGQVQILSQLTATGSFGGYVGLFASGDLFVAGDLRADSQGGDGVGGWVKATVGGALTLSGALVDANGAGAGGRGGLVRLVAAQDLLPDANTLIRSEGNGNGGGQAGELLLEGCQVVVPTGCRIRARGTPGPAAPLIVAHDLLSFHGTADGGSVPVLLATRLDAPWSPDLAGASFPSGSIVSHDRTLTPCLGIGFVTVSTNSPVHVLAGEVPEITVQGPAGLPLVVLAGWRQRFVPIGAYGFLQLDPARSQRLADPGHFGPPVQGSTLDAAGSWHWTGTPPSSAWIGLTAFVEALVEDPAARNGLFHQVPVGELAFTY
ncbi:MAG: hypothetical protein D6702_07705 [Planctomycetota bacterium]|nr:MAG: hypothetical protein D6702_07705 [Planctomycetota bacterium]